jgi:16S rRNA (guanine527-N7)-methyltransferase
MSIFVKNISLMILIEKYFRNLSDVQREQFVKLKAVYEEWNPKINVVSRKDISELYTRQVLHSLGIAKFIHFKSDTKVMDVGTGGGFPGIPLAILYPEVKFHLIDSIKKKLKVVSAVVEYLELKNVTVEHQRAEQVKGQFDFIISRAVTSMPVFVQWTHGKIAKKSKNSIQNGIIYLKGGDLEKELELFTNAKIYLLSDYFQESFFETKKIVYLPIQ